MRTRWTTRATYGPSWTWPTSLKRVRPGAVIVAGDETEPFIARVVDQVDGPGGRSIVHLDVLGVPDEVVEELRHANVIA